jgi:hypothetical protein
MSQANNSYQAKKPSFPPRPGGQNAPRPGGQGAPRPGGQTGPRPGGQNVPRPGGQTFVRKPIDRSAHSQDRRVPMVFVNENIKAPTIIIIDEEGNNV